MSAYMASPPVTARKAAPSTAKPTPGPACSQVGDGMQRVDGARGCAVPARCRASPSRPMATNQISITGPKMLPMNSVPLRWTRNSPTRIARLIGTTTRRELGRIELQALNSAEHRDGRRDHAIAVEQRGPDQADDEERGPPASGRGMPGIEQRQHRHDPALAVVIGAHDQDRVFERDDQDQRPEDHRDDRPMIVSGEGAPPASAACLKA